MSSDGDSTTTSQSQQSAPRPFDMDALTEDIREKIVPRSSELGSNSPVCESVAARLDALLDVVLSQTPEARAPIESKFQETVDVILGLIRTHQHYDWQLFWIANSLRLVRQITQTHTWIDEMYGELGVEEDPEFADWKTKMTEDTNEQVLSFRDDLSDTDESALVNEVNNPSKLKEIFSTLKNELKAPRVAEEAEMIELMRDLFDRIETNQDVVLGDAFSWFVASEEVKIDKNAAPIAEGTFGRLYRGTWSNKWTSRDVVAIKQLSVAMGTSDNEKKFSREVTVWSKLNHENILEMFGANHLDYPRFFISEYMTEGNFVDFFVRGDKGNQKWLWDFFKQAATGLQVLHTKKIEHGGLKTNNLLVTRVASGEHERLVVKVSDFGMSVVRNVSVTVSAYAYRDMGRWSALECLEHRSNGANGYVKSDIYSLGLCLVHAASGEKPYASFDIVTSTTKLENPICRPDGAFTDAEWSLVERMIDNEPANRPDLDKVIETMGELDDIRKQGHTSGAEAG